MKKSQIFIIFEVQAEPRRLPTIPSRRRRSIEEIESTAYIANPNQLRADFITKSPLGETISDPKPHKFANITYSDAYVQT